MRSIFRVGAASRTGPHPKNSFASLEVFRPPHEGEVTDSAFFSVECTKQTSPRGGCDERRRAVRSRARAGRPKSAGVADDDKHFRFASSLPEIRSRLAGSGFGALKERVSDPCNLLDRTSSPRGCA